MIKERFGGQPPPSGAEIFFPPTSRSSTISSWTTRDGTTSGAYEQDDAKRFFYDVFDQEGRFFARFSLPEDELLYAVRKGKAYSAIEENEAGVPQVKRYAVVWE
ncbi:MAG: hypothetical protein MZU91_11225 [Desulfosudis oleivorans]|nr:hypothetical protein [Desulfosudis oleivorans]